MSNNQPDGTSLAGAFCVLIAALLACLAFGMWFGLGGVAFVAAVIFLILGSLLP
jgi:hypothetical protein